MAPEQRDRPEEVDHRADIYSLGVVFYELLTGELPVGNFAPPSAKSAADPRVDHIVGQALENERERRQQSAGEVRTQVETVVGSPQAVPGSARGEAVPIKMARGRFHHTGVHGHAPRRILSMAGKRRTRPPLRPVGVRFGLAAHGGPPSQPARGASRPAAALDESRGACVYFNQLR